MSIASSEGTTDTEQGHHLCCSSHSQRSVSHTHAIQPFACHICYIAITVHNKAVPTSSNRNHNPDGIQTRWLMHDADWLSRLMVYSCDALTVAQQVQTETGQVYVLVAMPWDNCSITLLAGVCTKSCNWIPLNIVI